MLEWCYLASTCNSTVIEMYGDMIRISHGFEGCQRFGYIAVITTRNNKKAEPNDSAFFVVSLILLGCLFLKLPLNSYNSD
jgi:hypothetical protein